MPYCLQGKASHMCTHVAGTSSLEVMRPTGLLAHGRQRGTRTSPSFSLIVLGKQLTTKLFLCFFATT